MDFFFTISKLRNQIAELKGWRYRNEQALTEWYVIEDESKTAKYPPADMTAGKAAAIGSNWSGRDYYLWLQRDVIIPATGANCFYFDFGCTGEGHNSGFESLLFIDGEPYQGVDSNHKEVFLKPEHFGKTLRIALRLWSGLEGGGPEKIQHHEFKEASLVEVDQATDNLYYTSAMLVETAFQLAEDDPKRYEYIHRVDQSFRQLDWAYPGSTTFYASTAEANQQLQTFVDQLVKQEPVTVTALGHTHIDVAWLWRLKHTREKAARSFSTVLCLMEKYPDYVFLQTQPQLYQYIKEDYPEIFTKIKQRVKEGRWEIDGAMWLEADCNIPSGESLTRQILHGAVFIKKEFGETIHYLWLPDVFGYSWALPQILKKTGIDTFMTTKISWNQMNRMPHDTFIWKGIDGTEILTHFITTPTADPDRNWQTDQSWFYTYNGELEPNTVLGIYRNYQDKTINQDLLLSYGYGDGGGGVTRDMLEKRRRMEAIPGLPNLKTGRAREYFEKLQQTIANTDGYVHTWDGELYLEYHRGTYTSQAFVKQMNRKTELALRELEILYASREMTSGTAYPQKELFQSWQTLLRNQFHDIVPGSSIKEVYQDYRQEIGEVTSQLAKLRANLTEKTTEQVTIFNTQAWEQTELVQLPATKKFQTADGTPVPSVTYQGQSYGLVTVPALGSATFQPTTVAMTAAEEVMPDHIPIRYLETAFYQVEWNKSGQFTRLYDKELQREVLQGLGNVLQLFEDKPMNNDAWDIDIYYQQKVHPLQAKTIQVKARNKLFTVIEATYEFGHSSLAQEIFFYHHTKRIDFRTKAHWEERQQLLKVMFDVNVRATEATYDIQYGNVKRPTHWNTSWDLAKFETVGHQWADFSQHDFGVSLLNDCKYGYDIKNNQLRLSLLKGGIFPDPTADIGDHVFTYSLLPHKGDFIAGQTIQAAWQINQPLTVLSGAESEKIGIKIEAENEIVVIDALKKAEDGIGWILRLHDPVGATRQVQIMLPESFQWQETNLLEENQEKVQKGTVAFELHPYEIRTFRLIK